MKLEGANAFSENNLFTIYTVNSMTSGEYAVVMPKEVMGTVNMLIDFHQKSFFDILAPKVVKVELKEKEAKKPEEFEIEIQKKYLDKDSIP